MYSEKSGERGLGLKITSNEREWVLHEINRFDIGPSSSSDKIKGLTTVPDDRLGPVQPN